MEGGRERVRTKVNIIAYVQINRSRGGCEVWHLADDCDARRFNCHAFLLDLFPHIPAGTQNVEFCVKCAHTRNFGWCL